MTHPSITTAADDRAAVAAGPTAGEPATAEPALVDGVDVEAVARVVRACAGVSDLYSGRFGEIGSYLPGRRVAGVQVDDDTVTVQVKARWGYTPGDLFVQIIGVTTALRHGRAVNLVVADIDDDPSLAPPAGSRSDMSPPAIAPVTATSPSHPESSSS